MKETSKQLNHRKTAELAIQLLKNAIQNKSKTQVLASFDMVETEEFSWDDLDELFITFDELAEDANDIIYS